MPPLGSDNRGREFLLLSILGKEIGEEERRVEPRGDEGGGYKQDTN